MIYVHLYIFSSQKYIKEGELNPLNQMTSSTKHFKIT